MISKSKPEIYNMNQEEISQIIKENLIIDAKKKDKYGDVHTPPSLIVEMLDKLPKKIWHDPNRKWLDPAVGIGSFQMIVYERLFVGLEHWESDSAKRHNHIIQNMLFMYELNPQNVKRVRSFFGENANITKGDFLKSKEDQKYDVILGNPPFNDSQEASGKKGGGDSLWPDFVLKSLELLNPSGYLVFVHPASWRKPQSENSKTACLFKKMAVEKQIEYLEIHSKPDGVKLFDVQTRYDWYVLQNIPCLKPTIVKDETGEIHSIDLRDWEFLPNCYYAEVKSLLCKKREKHGFGRDCLEVIYSRNQFGTDKSWIRETENNEFKYPVIHSTPSDGTRTYWSNTKHPDIRNPIEMFGVKKIIFGESGIHNVVVDLYGDYGMTQGAIGIKIGSKIEGLQMKTALESEGFNRIIKALSFGNFRIDWRMFLFFKKDFHTFFLKKREKRKTSNIRTKSKKNKTRKLRFAIHKINRL
jgi:hypothetical protein